YLLSNSPALRKTSFHYSTHFRSHCVRHHLRYLRMTPPQIWPLAIQPSQRLTPLQSPHIPRLYSLQRQSILKARRQSRRPLVVVRDRKSTRLNSSHVSISYAVVCC